MNGFILVTENRLLIEKVTALQSSKPNADYHLLSTSNFEDVTEDITLFGADALVIDAICYQLSYAMELVQNVVEHSETDCRIILLIHNDQIENMEAIVADGCSIPVDYVLYDEDLSGLFDKLAAI